MHPRELPGYDPSEPILAVVEWAKKRHRLQVWSGREFGLDPLLMVFTTEDGDSVVATHDSAYRRDPFGVAEDVLFHVEASRDMRRRRS